MNNEMSRAHESPYEISLAGQGETERFQQEITRKTDGDANNAINQNQWRTIEWWMPVARVNLDAPHHLVDARGHHPTAPLPATDQNTGLFLYRELILLKSSK